METLDSFLLGYWLLRGVFLGPSTTAKHKDDLMEPSGIKNHWWNAVLNGLLSLLSLPVLRFPGVCDCEIVTG